MLRTFPFYAQHDQMDCGPSCLRMITKYYGKNFSLHYLKENSYITREGVSLLGITEAATKLGLKSISAKLTLDQLLDESNLPCVLHWNQNHFVVLYKMKRTLLRGSKVFYIADPAHGLVKLNEERFRKSWIQDNEKGIALFLFPTEEFEQLEEKKEHKVNFSMLTKMLKPYRKELLQLVVGMLISSLITLIFPFLTQMLIDKGVASRNLSVVFIILLAQVFLFLGSVVLEVVRNWVLLYVGTRINVTIISEFLAKIFKLPIRFFDAKQMGDFNQRINDHERIEQFLTSHSLVTLFSAINFLVFFFVLLNYNTFIVLIYTLLTAAAISWSVLFLKRRKNLDYYKFQRRSENQESIYELINGIQEIKLNDFESYKRNEWEKIQIKLFRINLRILKLDQLQLVGFDFLNQLKNILVTFLAAQEVINGNLSLGAMLAISYIIGQLNAPVSQMVAFLRSLQDARLSLERLNEVHETEEEERSDLKSMSLVLNPLKTTGGIEIRELGFQYEGPNSPYILRNIDLDIPTGKTTAIVGESGSGKTTFMKLLLKFYPLSEGNVFLNGSDLEHISPSDWRKNCGVVMQEGYLFSETIERNIAMGDEDIDQQKMEYAIKIANIQRFIESLPLKLKTKVGLDGNGLSGGQKQRLLIARAVYKNPQYIFLDEATSALDAENEKIIHENLNAFFEGRTVVIIAHRLSTVRNADQIIVLKEGEIVERGTHEELVSNKAYYFNLIKNQLELGV